MVPDGVVCFFVSYLYMDQIISKWHEMGILDELMQHKLVFIETQVGAGPISDKLRLTSFVLVQTVSMCSLAISK